MSFSADFPSRRQSLRKARMAWLNMHGKGVVPPDEAKLTADAMEREEKEQWLQNFRITSTRRGNRFYDLWMAAGGDSSFRGYSANVILDELDEDAWRAQYEGVWEPWKPEQEHRDFRLRDRLTGDDAHDAMRLALSPDYPLARRYQLECPKPSEV